MTAGPSDSAGELASWCGKGALKLGINLSREEKELFERYYKIIIKKNRQAGLTAIVSEKEAALKHFVDSLSCLLAAPFEENSFVADLGSGAGLPGIPLKIVRPEISLTLIDSSNKKVEFLNEVVQYLGLRKVKVLPGRAEEISHKPEYRGRFDYVVCRAVAALPVLIEYCLGLVKTGGLFIALKGPSSVEEEKKSERALSQLGGTIHEVKEFNLPFIGHRRRLITIKKVSQTPPAYPRRAGLPGKRPL